MKKLASLSSVLAALPLAACGTMALDEPQSLGERNAAYSYIPLDPLPVFITNRKGCPTASASDPRTLMDSLPDNAVRIAIREIIGKGDVSLGPVAVGTSGSRYQVVLDYINVDTANIRFSVGVKGDEELLPLSTYSEGREYFARRIDDSAVTGPNLVVIPVYVGVGLRLTANVEVLRGKVNLASLGAIAAGAEANRVAGSLVVQTLGINGKQVAATLPLPSELNATTVQQAIQSLGAIKAIMYDTQNTRVVPRVTGIYNPLETDDPKLINLIVSQLAESHIPWSPPCAGAGTTAD
ncbi:MAG TPA: hypothetical protein VF547_01290 [Allosphingosinicella sp.]|jgi:hypothetical protein